MKLDANIEAVTLRQSVQLQRNVSTRPSPDVGYWAVINIFGVLKIIMYMVGGTEPVHT